MVFCSIGVVAQTPIPDWVKDIGGTGESKLTGIGVDQSDNVYVAGNFQGTLTVDHSGVSTPVPLSSVANYDIFLAKYTPDGKLLWAKSIGGNGLDQVNNLTIDLNGNVIISASTTSSVIDCDPGPGTTNLTGNGAEDALVVKFDTNGNFLWGKNIGGTQTDRGHVVTTDKQNNVIFVGSFSTSITVGGFLLTNKGLLDGFMVKYDPNGNVLWAYGMGTASDDEIKSVKTNSNNEIVITGYFNGTIDLNPKGPPSNLTATSANPYFMAKYSPNGDLIWGNPIYGTSGGAQIVAQIAIGPTDEIFITGSFGAELNLVSPPNTLTIYGNSTRHLFVAKYTNLGVPVWAKYASSSITASYSYYITVDVDNNAYIGGFYEGSLTFYGATPMVLTINAGTNRRTFFGKFDGNGQYLWAFDLGSNCSGNFGHKIAVDSKKNVLLGGAFCGTVDFNTGTCTLNLTAKHNVSDAFISKFNQIKFTGDALITDFDLDEQVQPAIISNIDKKVTITVQPGTDVTHLKPRISADIGIISPLSEVVRDFTTPQTYTITSNCVNYNWTVEVMVAQANLQLTLCSGESTSFTPLPNPAPESTYQWVMEDTILSPGIWVVAPGTSDQASYTFPGVPNTSNAALVFRIRRRTLNNSGLSYEAESTVTINPITTNNSITTPQLVFCNGKANITLSGTTPNGGINGQTTFAWEQSSDGSNWNTINTVTSKDYTPAEFYQTTYFRRATLNSGCKTYCNELKVEVFLPPTTAGAGTDINLCNIQSATLNANTVANGETGTWSVISPAGYNPFTALTVNDPKASIANLPENVPVVLRWTIKQQGGCQLESFDEVTVTNFGTPALAMPGHMTINYGQALPIPATLATAAGVTYTYQWTPATDISDPTILAPMVSPSETTIYRLRINYGTCILEQEIKIIVDKEKEVSVCSGGPLTLQGAVDHDPQSIYQWQQRIGGVWTDLPGKTTADLSITPNNNFTNSTVLVSFRRIVTNSPYYDSQFLVKVLATTTNNLITTPQTTFCAASANNLTLTGTVPTGANHTNITFAWQRSADGITWTALADQTQHLTLPQLSSTTFFRRITFADACESYSNEIKINIFPVPTTAAAGPDVNICSSRDVTLAANSAANNETGTWTVVSPTSYQPFDAQNEHDPHAQVLNLPYNEPVVLRWTITNQNCGIATADEITITTFSPLTTNAPAALQVDYGKSIELEVTANLDPALTYTYQWSPSTGLDRTDVLHPIASPTNDITYTLTISYGVSCVKTLSINVKVIKEITFPNSFSPNGDGVNDEWEIKNFSGYPGSRLSIFNRYGTVIYTANSNNGKWDGKMNGRPLPAGVYYYVIVLNDKKKSTYNGIITILN
ncbi:MAG: gliding motility-associated C-terminal domain-containing protein [Pedobacter sp.]|nr:gliding motility-associated C-terminal domain-containing protein [Pedobacter sp.]